MYKVKNFVRDTSNYFTENRKKLEMARKYRESTENHSKYKKCISKIKTGFCYKDVLKCIHVFF